MKKIVLTIILFTSLLSSYSQEYFPESWIGTYKGNLEVYTVDSIALQVEMELIIAPTAKDSLLDWTIIYERKNIKDIRSYTLKILNTEKGIYKIDEKNGIVIDTFYHYDFLTSFFKVMDNFIIATYRKEMDMIIFEIIVSDSKEMSLTGGLRIKEEDIPEVMSYKVSSRQRAILYKQRN